MATISEFLQSPLVTWAYTFNGNKKPETVADFADGVFLNEIMVEIDPTYFTLSRVQHNVYGDISTRVQNLDTLVRHLKCYYQERLQQVVLARIPDIVLIAHDPEIDASIEELTRILLLMLGVAVQCENKEHFIRKIKELDFEVQRLLVDCIKQVTDNTDNVLPFRLSEIAEYPVEQLILMAETMYYHIGQLVDERDASVGMITHLTYERDSLLKEQESHPKTSLSPPLSPRHSFKKTSPVLTATKEKLRLLTEEVEEKNIMIQELKEELLQGKRIIEKLRQDNKNLSQDARWVKAYRDESDMLKAKADKVDKLEADNVKYKDKLRDLDYYKKRAEELKEQNEMLYDTKVVLEEQLVGLSTKDEKLELSEEANKKLKSHIHELAEERQIDQVKLKEVMEENAQLVLDKQNSMAELAALMAELDFLRGKVSPGTNSLASEYKEQNSVEILRLQKENQQLQKTVARVEDLERKNQELRNVLKINNSELKAKAKQLGSDTYKELQLEDSLSLSTHQQENTHVVDSNRHKKNFTKEKLRAEEENIVRLKQQVKDSEIKETNLCKQLKEKANRIVELTETIQEREKSLGILETRLKENEEQQYKVENKMKNQQKEISDLEQRMEELLSTTSTAHKQLKAKDRELDELSSRLEDTLSHKNRCDDNLRRKEKECYDLKNRIDKLTAENERLAENARIKEEKIASLKTRIEELLRSLDEKNDLFNKDLREKEKENKELERRVESLGDLVEEVKRLKDLVRQKEAKLETLSVTLQEKTGKLHHLETRLEDLDNGNKKLVHTLKLKEKKIESLESSLAEVETDASSTYLKEGKIAEMRKSIEGKDNKILELENRLEDLVSCNNKMQHILKLKDEKLQELEKQIQEIEVAAAEKTKLSQALDHKLKKIQSLEKRNEDLANETLQLRNDVDLKDSRLKSLETRISELEESLKSCQLIEHDLKYKDDRITSLGRIIQEREEKLAELEHRFEDTQAHNHKLNRSVKIKEDKISVLENRLEQLEGITAEKQKLSQLLQQREEKIIVLDSKIDELKDVLAENEKLAHVTKQKDEKLQRLQERLDEVEDAVKMNSRLNHFLKQRDEKIKSQDNRINELQSSIESREEQYQKEKSHLEYRIKTLERNLEEVSQAKVQRTNSVKRREEKIVDLDKKRTALEQYLQEREGRIQDLQNKLEGSSDRFRRLDISVGEKEMRIAELEAKLLEAQDDARENRKLNQIMKTKDARIDSLETKMQNIEGLLKKYKAEVQEKSEKLDNVQQRLEETLNLNNKLDQSVRKKEENIRTLEKNIQSIEKREEELEELLETKGEKLAEYKKRVLELEDGLEEKIDKINEQQKRLDDVLKSANADQNYRVIVEEKQSRIMELEREIKELKDSSDSVKCSTVEVQYLNNAVKKQKEKVQELQTKLDEYIDYSKKLDFENKQKHKTIETLEKRVEQLVANQDTADKSQYKALQQKDSKMATMNSTLHQQESEILSLESRLDEAAARVDKLNQTVEQKEERIKALKIRLEDAVHQNNKLNHTLELKDDKIHGLERRLEDSLKEFDVLRGNLAALDRKPEGEKNSKSKGSSSQTIIFKPANNANNMKAVELIADAERRLEERNEEVRILEKQNATLGAQSESMSAKNASLVIENESLKNDLKNLKSDYSNLLTDVGEARDYYNQLDISASKMVHRCEMLEQLNCTLEEENKALMEQVTKLVSQNQQMLMRSLDDKEQSMEDERLFSDRLFALQREKERLEEQVELANRALAECTPTKKKRNMFKRGAHRMLKATGLKKKKDESNKKATVQLLRVDHSPFREHFDSYRPVNADLESEGYCSTVNVTPLKSRNDDSRSSFDSRDSSASGDSSKVSNRSHGSFLPVSQSEVHLRRPKDSHTLPRSTSTANAVQLRRQSQDVSAYRARHVRSEYYGDRDLSPVKLHRPKSLDALNKISDDSSPLPGTRVRVNSNNVRMSKTVQDGPSPFRRQQKIASSSPATPTGMRRRSPPRQTSSPRVSPTTSPHVSPKSSPIQARKLYSSPPSPAMSRSSAGSFCGDTLPVKERNLNTPVNENYSMLPSLLSSTVVRGGTTFALTSSSSSSFKTTDPQEVANPQVSSSSDPAYRKEGGRPKSYNATPVKESRPGEEKVIHTSQTDDAPIERFVREMERSKELNRGSFRGSNRSLSGSSLRGSNRSLNRVTASALTSRQGTTVYAVYSSTSNQKDSINNTENVMIDATGIDVNITPASEVLSASSQLPPSGPLEETNRPTRDSGVRVKTNETSSVPPTSNLKNETLAGNDSYQRDELNPNYVSTSSSRSRSMSGRSITSQSLTAQTRNVGDEKTVVIARVRELEQQNGESCHLRSPSTSSIVSVGADDDYKSRSVNSDVQQGVRKQQKNNGHKKKDERIQSKVVSAAQKENTISRENDRNESHVSNNSTTGSATNQGKKVQPVWYEYGCV